MQVAFPARNCQEVTLALNSLLLLPIPDICCEQEASAAAGNKGSAIASPAATSLEYGVMLLK